MTEALFRIYNQTLGDLAKFSLEQFVRTVQKMLQRGGSSYNSYNSGGQSNQQRVTASNNNSNIRKTRIVLSSNVLLELLYGAYFAIYNGFQLGGSQVRNFS